MWSGGFDALVAQRLRPPFDDEARRLRVQVREGDFGDVGDEAVGFG